MLAKDGKQVLVPYFDSYIQMPKKNFRLSAGARAHVRQKLARDMLSSDGLCADGVSWLPLLPAEEAVHQPLRLTTRGPWLVEIAIANQSHARARARARQLMTRVREWEEYSRQQGTSSFPFAKPLFLISRSMPTANADGLYRSEGT